ncbi:MULTISPECIES: hypothetical protein [Xenorhabdus]|uniref:hypothetical protein n=1 Tax=Xenorhabdus TaxID=626 RepID=UPI000B266AC3|nr:MULTISPECIES: hypothetical protein [Xenorhabdus]
MNLRNKIQLIAVGLMMVGSVMAVPDALNGYEKLKIKSLEVGCPGCTLVAQDVLEIRAQNCQLKNTSLPMIVDTILNDPMFAFMLETYTVAGMDTTRLLRQQQLRTLTVKIRRIGSN